jgi:hypothetical protein
MGKILFTTPTPREAWRFAPNPARDGGSALKASGIDIKLSGKRQGWGFPPVGHWEEAFSKADSQGDKN